MTGQDEPEEIRKLRAVDAEVDAASQAFTGDPAEREAALRRLNDAIALAAGRAAVLAWLAGRRATVWERWADVAPPTDQRQAWETAVAEWREALVHTAEDAHRGRLIRATNLAADLLRLYGVTGEPGTLDEAVHLLGRALEATPREDPAAAARAANLAAALEERFTLTGQDHDLDVAVDVLDIAAAQHPEHVATSVNLAAVLRTRFRARGDEADLDAAEQVLRRIPDAENDPEAMSGLGLALMNRFEISGGVARLEEAIQWLSSAVDATPPRSARVASRLNNLALALLDWGEFITGARPTSTARSRCCSRPSPPRHPGQLNGPRG